MASTTKKTLYTSPWWMIILAIIGSLAILGPIRDGATKVVEKATAPAGAQAAK